MVKAFAKLLSFSLLSLAACAGEDLPELSTDQSAIIGGTNTAVGDYPTVVVIEVQVGQGAGICTGTLISPTTVLTAAHCVTPAVLGLGSQAQVTASTKVRIDSNRAFSGGTLVPVIDTIPHPGFNVQALGDNDIGVIRLGTPVTDRVPTPLNRVFNDAKPGTSVTQVGFGVSQLNANGTINQASAGTEHTLTNRISQSCSALGASDTNLICFSQLDKTGKCEGDSGGPSFATINGVQTLVGVTSFGDQNCSQFGADTRVDGELDFIIANVPELSCVADGACSEACGKDGLPADPDCQTCSGNGDCDDGYVCSQGICEAGPTIPGGVGSDCTSNDECNAPLACGEGPDGTRKCTESCTPGGTDCPEGFDCLTAGTGGACWPSPGGGGEDDDGGGCGCHVGASKSTGATGGFMLLLVVGAFVARRRRR